MKLETVQFIKIPIISIQDMTKIINRAKKNRKRKRTNTFQPVNRQSVREISFHEDKIASEESEITPKCVGAAIATADCMRNLHKLHFIYIDTKFEEHSRSQRLRDHFNALLPDFFESLNCPEYVIRTKENIVYENIFDIIL